MVKWRFWLNASQNAAQLFKANVKEVNVEISGYCNRKCPYCPNSLEPQYRGEKLDENIFMTLLEDLRSIGFDGKVHLNLYNEPLHDFEFYCECADMVQHYLPAAALILYTNGDYLTREKLDRLVTLKHRCICVTIHYTDAWDEPDQLDRLQKFLVRLRLNMPVAVGDRSIVAQGEFGETWLQVRALDFSRFGSDRGGALAETVATAKRTRPCSFPQWQINIGHQGDVYPCCNLFPRQELNGKYASGNLVDTDIFAIYASHRAENFRRLTASISPWTPELTPKCCQNCITPDSGS